MSQIQMRRVCAEFRHTVTTHTNKPHHICARVMSYIQLRQVKTDCSGARLWMQYLYPTRSVSIWGISARSSAAHLLMCTRKPRRPRIWCVHVCLCLCTLSQACSWGCKASTMPYGVEVPKSVTRLPRWQHFQGYITTRLESFRSITARVRLSLPCGAAALRFPHVYVVLRPGLLLHMASHRSSCSCATFTPLLVESVEPQPTQAPTTQKMLSSVFVSIFKILLKTPSIPPPRPECCLFVF